MNLFDVYSRYPIIPIKGKGSWLWDDLNERYLDFYGGHAVISIGHSHPHYQERIINQLNNLGFYSNSIQIPIQHELATKLGQMSGYETCQLFLCNSGAEANENALKLASFHTGRKKIIAFEGGFHGRTSLAVAASDNPNIQAPINSADNIIRLPFNNIILLEKYLDDTIAAVIIEGIQGINGIQFPDDSFLKSLEHLCIKSGSLLIIDEIQSGYGRTGKFFAHQFAGITPDIVTVAKGMGNGFPIGGVLIAPKINPWTGMLGSTFGGNHLACAAALAVLEVIEQEDLLTNSGNMGTYLLNKLKQFDELVDIRARGLMIGLDLQFDTRKLRKTLLIDHKVFVGSATNPNTIRLLPALNINEKEIDFFIEAFKKSL